MMAEDTGLGCLPAPEQSIAEPSDRDQLRFAARLSGRLAA
jgi:hypothetical protein